MGKTKARVKSGIKKVLSAVKTVKPLAKIAAKVSPLGRVSNVVTAVQAGTTAFKKIPKKVNQKMGRTAKTAKGKGTGRKKQTVASIKKKILMLKLKKELAKVRGY